MNHRRVGLPLPRQRFTGVAGGLGRSSSTIFSTLYRSVTASVFESISAIPDGESCHSGRAIDTARAPDIAGNQHELAAVRSLRRGRNANVRQGQREYERKRPASHHRAVCPGAGLGQLCWANSQSISPGSANARVQISCPAPWYSV
jgi:hypothetical protein